MQAAQKREAALQAELADLRESLFGRKSEGTPPGKAGSPADGTAGEEPPATAPPAGGRRCGGRFEEESRSRRPMVVQGLALMGRAIALSARTSRSGPAWTCRQVRNL